MLKTHFERQMEDCSPYLNGARAAVKRAGVDAYLEYIDRMVEVRGPQTVQPLAISFAIAERIGNEVADPYSLRQVSDSKTGAAMILLMRRLASMLSGTSRLVQNDEVAANFVMFWHMACHDRAGRRVYEVDTRLAQRLLATEVRGITTDDIRLPYKAIYLTVPPETGITVWNHQTGEHRLNGMYITEDTSDADERHWRFLLLGAPHEGEDAYNDSIFQFSIGLPAGMDLQQMLEMNRLTFERVAALKSLISKESSEFGRQVWLKAFTYAMNVILYSTWAEARIEEFDANKVTRDLDARLQKAQGGKRAKILNQLRAQTRMKRIYLGRGTAPLDEQPGTPRGPLMKRTLVMGHWRMQAHGVGRALRKRIWIEPFWRGPLDVAEDPARHVVTDGEE